MSVYTLFDQTAKLELLVQGRYGGMSGLSRLDADMGRFSSRSKALVEQARVAAEKAAAMQKRSTLDYERAEERKLRATEDRLKAENRMQEAAQKGNIARYRNAVVEHERAQRQMAAATKASVDAQIAANDRLAASTAAASAYGRTRIMGGIATGAGVAGRYALGIGGVGLLAGGFLVNRAAQWMKLGSQTQAGTTLNDRQMRMLQAFAQNLAVQSGGSATDILTAGRYGSDMLGSDPRNFRLNLRTIRAATMAALPTGGNISDMLAAIGTGQVNFPAYRNAPNQVAGMLLMAAKMGRVTPQALATAAPQTLMLAGHYGSQMLPQSLAMIAAITRANGGNVDEANTMAYNTILKMATPTPKTVQWLNFLKSKGVDLTGDFSGAGLQQKGMVGVLSDVRRANLSPDVLRHLFPYARSYLGALGLTGNQYGSFMNTYGALSGGAPQQALVSNYQRYQRLPTTQFERERQVFDKTAITLGTALMPAVVALMKAVTPLVNQFARWAEHHKTLIASAFKLVPALLGVGVALKGINALMTVATINPYILALVGLGVLLVALYTKSERFRNGVNALARDLTLLVMHPIDAAKKLLQWFKDHWLTALPALFMGPFFAFNTYIASKFFPDVVGKLGKGLDSIQSWLTNSWFAKILGGIIAPFQEAGNWIASHVPGPVAAAAGWASSGTSVSGLVSKGRAATTYTSKSNLILGASSAATNKNALIGGAASGRAPASVASAYPQVAQWWPIIAIAAKKNHLDPYLLASLMAQESSGSIAARPTWNPYEKAWDYGLYQYGPPEAASVGGQYGPHVSGYDQIMTAAAYLAKVGLGAWNGPAEAASVLARANAWAGRSSTMVSVPSGAQGPQVTLGSLGLGPGGILPKAPPVLSAHQKWMNRVIKPLQNAIHGESLAASAIKRVWSGINPANLPGSGHHGLNQRNWLRDQYRLNELLREEYDQKARIAWLEKQITWQQYQQLKQKDLDARNVQNQKVRDRLHGISTSTNVGRIQTIHVTSHCDRVAQNHRHNIAAATHKTAQNTGSIDKKLDTLIAATHAVGAALGSQQRHHHGGRSGLGGGREMGLNYAAEVGN